LSLAKERKCVREREREKDVTEEEQTVGGGTHSETTGIIAGIKTIHEMLSV
jgi:hypothetical protein